MADLKNTSITGSLQLPSGTTAQRPTNPPNGAVRFNTTLGYTEVYNNGFWGDLASNNGLPEKRANVFTLDAGIPASYSGSGTIWSSIGPVANRNFTLVGSPTFTSSGLQSYFTFNESQMAYCQDVCATNYCTVEIVFQKYGDSPEDILFNKENTWEMKTDSNTVQWALYASNQSWFWQNTGSISQNTTYYVALTYDGQFVRTYLNGRRREQYTYPWGGVLANQTSAYPKINARGTPQTNIDNPGFHRVYYFSLSSEVYNENEIQKNFGAFAPRWGLNLAY